MGRRPEKYVRTREKLQWFFEQMSVLELQSLSLDRSIVFTGRSALYSRKSERRLEAIRIGRILDELCHGKGISFGEGRRLRLTAKMIRHVILEFTSGGRGCEAVYGATSNKKKTKHFQDKFRQTLNRALARIEAAFYATGIFQRRQNRLLIEKKATRNEFGYMVELEEKIRKKQ